jgi:hypothetical protein
VHFILSDSILSAPFRCAPNRRAESHPQRFHWHVDRAGGRLEAAIQLNPHHPGWYWLTSVFNIYRKRDYRASAAALRTNMPGYFRKPATSAAALGQLGERESAEKAVKELLAIRPDFAANARAEFGKWFDDALTEHYVAGLQKAGLQILHGAQS